MSVSLVEKLKALTLQEEKMLYPSSYDFLEAFGLVPVEVDLSIGLYRYIQQANNTALEIDISFSVMMKSFQIVLRLSGQEISMISSEGVESIKIVKDNLGEGLHVVFEVCDITSEARVTLEPYVNLQWWILRS